MIRDRYLRAIALAALLCVTPVFAAGVTIDGTAHPSLQAAVDALPESGGEIRLAPGEYREKVLVTKPGVHLRGTGKLPADVVIVWGDSSASVGGTVKSASLTASGDGFRAHNLTIANDWNYAAQPSQAVALAITADRAVLERVRLLGAQDTLYAASKKCAAEPCPPSRQYFRDCYVEGHVDFIFGDAKALFDRCRIHAKAHAEVMITAHSRTAPEQDKAYVFDRCRITADADARTIYFGRPWRDYAAVVFLDTRIDAPVHPDGWREWTPGTTNRLPLAYYAEYGSTGKYGDMRRREPHAIRLSAAQAKRWRKDTFLAGSDGWRP